MVLKLTPIQSLLAGAEVPVTFFYSLKVAFEGIYSLNLAQISFLSLS